MPMTTSFRRRPAFLHCIFCVSNCFATCTPDGVLGLSSISEKCPQTQRSLPIRAIGQLAATRVIVVKVQSMAARKASPNSPIFCVKDCKAKQQNRIQGDEPSGSSPFYSGISNFSIAAACATSLSPRPERFMVSSTARRIRRATRSNTRLLSRPSVFQPLAIPDRYGRRRWAATCELV